MAQPQQVVFPPTNVFKLFDLEAASNTFTPSVDSDNVLSVTTSDGVTDVLRVDTTNKSVYVGGAMDESLYDPNINFYVTANIDSYSGINVWNINSGTSGSTDIVAANDSAAGYVDMIITSEGNTDPAYPIYQGGKAGLYASSTDLLVGSDSSTLSFFAGGVETDNIGATLAEDGSGWTFQHPVVFSASSSALSLHTT